MKIWILMRDDMCNPSALHVQQGLFGTIAYRCKKETSFRGAFKDYNTMISLVQEGIEAHKKELADHMKTGHWKEFTADVTIHNYHGDFSEAYGPFPVASVHFKRTGQTDHVEEETSYYYAYEADM